MALLLWRWSVYTHIIYSKQCYFFKVKNTLILPNPGQFFLIWL
ncbi:Uncharacterized protein dnl_14250 [Desulfonema limicola]|uniref:Uncharacterized protein n=1 Tax=Desulfonema limicola TaxID=45656 RepID=A0A975B5H1_9BACT|nr:Uncharacterized protein dnl_14250 [Desulfonema limicola]